METKEIEKTLREVASTLILIPLDDLEQHDKNCLKSVSDFDAFAPILAPADYFTKRNSGELEFIRLQNEIGHKCLELRRLLEQLPLGVKVQFFIANPDEWLKDNEG